MVNNINIIKPLLNFQEGYFYYLQILQRKKENPKLGSNSRVIKNYFITSEEYLDSIYEEVKQLCDFFNARASLRLNRRSFEKVSFKTMVNIANCMSNKDYMNVKNAYSRAVGKCNDEDKENKTWILDWDEEFNILHKFQIREFIDKCEPLITGDKCKAYIPSKSGMHIITQPFDPRKFKKEFPNVEIHKDNPTNLYIS